ncbi:MAG: hypothetical protein ACMVY4_05140 [Minwuia sp.]|uniref:hypothetical protein n=1 Tax=Minwuia sp. TaxID=2493630 RepID=UPI003A85B64A
MSESIWGLLDNPWVVGIGGGILSGLFVALVTRVIFGRRDKKEYNQKVFRANSEVVYAIRPGISEGIIPNGEVIKKLSSATARKYDVNDQDLYDIDEISGELIKEVMDSSFISAEMKNDYCVKISNISKDAPRSESPAPESRNEDARKAAYVGQLSVIVSLMAGVATALAVGLDIGGTENKTIVDDFEVISLISLGTVSIAVLGVLISRAARDLKISSAELRLAGISASFRSKSDHHEKKKPLSDADEAR